MKIYVDIDNTICTQELEDYGQAKPWLENIMKINVNIGEIHYQK